MAEEMSESGEVGREEELMAFNKVADALRPLSADARGRVIQTIGVFFRLGGSAPTMATTGVRQSHGAPSVAAFSEDRSQTPKEFMFEKKPVTDIERVACLAYYLTHYQSTPHFKTLDLSKLNTDAAQIKFSNAAAAVDNATKAGLLVQATKGAKQLSALGELYVQALPDRTAAKAAIAQGRPRRVRSRGGSSKGRASEE